MNHLIERGRAADVGRRRRGLWACAMMGGAGLAALGGCVSEDTPAVESWVVMSNQPAGAKGETISAADAVLNVPAQVAMRDAMGADRLAITREPPKASGTWTIRERLTKDGQVEEKSGSDTVLRQDGGGGAVKGAVAIVSRVDLGEGVTTTFDPPLTLMPGTLKAGQVDKQTVKMTNSGKDTHSGKAEQTIEYVADEKVRTPAGTFTAQHVRTTLTAELGLPKIHSVTDTWYVAGIGMVAERRDDSATALGVSVHHTLAMWVLEKMPEKGKSKAKSEK